MLRMVKRVGNILFVVFIIAATNGTKSANCNETFNMQQSAAQKTASNTKQNGWGMQNDRAYHSAGSGQHQQPHYFGNVRRVPASPPLPMHAPTSHDPQVEYTREIIIKQGRLRGMVRSMHSQSGLRDVNLFLGIPYAAAPVGSGRFMPPGAPPPWNGSKMFTALSPVCPQRLPQINGTSANTQLSAGRYDQLKRLLPFLRHENENCLFLNLYAPQLRTDDDKQTRVPVIVFVHGESFEWNSGNPYDGSVLASYGQVLVVTLNYRLGILGELIVSCMRRYRIISGTRSMHSMCIPYVCICI